MPHGKSARLAAAQESLNAAILEMVAASDEDELAYHRRVGPSESEEMMLKLQGSVVTHWVVAISRTYWERDADDPADPTERPYAVAGTLVRDDTMPGWMVSGLLRKSAKVVDEFG